jgi:hypothetical protein
MMATDNSYDFFGLFDAGFQLWHVPLGLIVKSQFDFMFAQDGQRMLDGEFALAKALASEPLGGHDGRWPPARLHGKGVGGAETWTVG